MNREDCLNEFISRLEADGINPVSKCDKTLAPAHKLEIRPDSWRPAAQLARQLNLRWSALWGDERTSDFHLFAALDYHGQYIILHTRLPLENPEIESQAQIFPAASRLERHLTDMLGIRFLDSPEPQKWTRHRAWGKNEFPLRQDYPVEGHGQGHTPGDDEYSFSGIQGSGVLEIPVGPVHAGIIEPGHFRFQVAGEPILRMQERLGYTHKGIEKIAVGRDPESLVRLAGRVSGDSTVAHAWAACQALERASGFSLSNRASLLRGLLCERERVVNHLADIGAICNDVGFAFAQMQCQALREPWLRRNKEWTGHRLMMDAIIPGGVAVNLAPSLIPVLHHDHSELRDRAQSLFDIINDQPSLEDRLLGTGHLSQESASELGASGYVGKASGQSSDLRATAAYAPYHQLTLQPSVDKAGDVAARVKIRQLEILSSLDLMDAMLNLLSEGDASEPALASFSSSAEAEGLGLVEGWRGEIVTYLRLDENGRVARFFARDPSWLTWPALERIVLGNIVPDFPVCNKSVNGSYSGQDL